MADLFVLGILGLVVFVVLSCHSNPVCAGDSGPCSVCSAVMSFVLGILALVVFVVLSCQSNPVCAGDSGPCSVCSAVMSV